MPLRLILILVAAGCTRLSADEPAAADNDLQRGAEIFAERCVSCHGERGEGVVDLCPKPIFGDKSNFELAQVISETMPEGEPEMCTGEDAEVVARWMQQAFYSPEAQARIHPPQIALSRLTVSQYRNTVADVAASFSWTAQPGDKHGLAAQYYKSRHFRNDEQAFDRIDPVVDFNFGEGTPDAEQIPGNEEFSVRWQGSLIVDETGWYDFVLKTENGGRLFVNDTDTPLIDAWVKSGDIREYRERLFLLSGRLYPIRLHWFTFKEPTASVGLWWRPPGGVDQPIPERCLTPEGSPTILVIDTPFPPDDRSSGYERGTYVSREWDEAVTYAAIEAAEDVQRMLGLLVNTKEDEGRPERLRQFAETFVTRAFRRPLTDELRQSYVTAQFEKSETPDEAVRRVVLLALKSPRFLYREVTGADDQFARASRLSFALMNSVPDAQLLQAAENGELSDEQAVRNQAWRLVSSYRSRTRLQEFLRSWMNLERLSDVSKDTEAYPDFTADVAFDLRTSLELLLREAVESDSDGFRKLLTTENVWLNHRLAEFYGVELPGDSDFHSVPFEPEYRSGVISHPFILSGFAYHSTSSPIHRGVFVSRGILGRALKAPPVAVAPLPPELNPELTTRERVTLQTSPAACANCHDMINPLGYALEEFDAVGRFRTTEKDRPIDDSGHYRDRTGEDQQFHGAKELAAFLVDSPETHRSFVRQLFHHMVQQPILAFGPDTVQELADFFKSTDFNMKQIMVEIAVRSAMHQNSADVASGNQETPTAGTH
ncbi:MAG: DUF1592 domain-containing protein [Planctomycetaceae bacterium]